MLGLPRIDIGLRLFGRAAHVPGIEDHVALERAELALAGRMVHDRGQPRRRVVGEGIEVSHDVVAGQFATQVNKVLGTQPAALAAGPHRIDQLSRMRQHVGQIDVRSDAHRVEDGGDARSGNLHIMRVQRRLRIPEDARSGPIVIFQVVRVQFDQARDQIIAAEVFALQAYASVDARNPARANHQASLDDLVRQHDAGIGEDDFGHDQPPRPYSAMRRKGSLFSVSWNSVRRSSTIGCSSMGPNHVRAAESISARSYSLRRSVRVI